MQQIRVFYNKVGRLKFVSHLDLNRFFIRVLRKSGLNCYYSEGFNKRLHINFALPLSLGFESENDAVDFKELDDLPLETVAQKIKAVMPQGLEFVGVSNPVHKTGEIAFAKYSLFFENAQIAKELEDFLSKDSIEIEKTGKKGKITALDLKPHIHNPQITQNQNGTLFELFLPAGTPLNINPSLLLSAFDGGKNYCNVTRKGLCLSDFSPFC
ncbi:MAG: TIGR03936 family radical SAM-associated protein [Oscillospiraceae bacterium]|nr:TIGR03936 family radical SAM-associated protein [Candidatus Equicaccousia limihippi]